MTWEDLQTEVAEEFDRTSPADIRIWRPPFSAFEGFDIDDSSAMAAEVERLERRRKALWLRLEREQREKEERRVRSKFVVPEVDPICGYRHCSNPVPVNKYSYTNKLFCSEGCRNREWSAVNRPSVTERVCQWCGRTFVGSRKSFYCSVRHRNAKYWRVKRTEAA